MLLFLLLQDVQFYAPYVVYSFSHTACYPAILQFARIGELQKIEKIKLIPNFKTMVKGNFLGAGIVAIIYTVYVVWHPLASRPQTAVVLVVLNVLTVVLMSFAFKAI